MYCIIFVSQIFYYIYVTFILICCFFRSADETIPHKNFHTDTKKLNIMHPALCTLAIDLMTFARFDSV